MFAFHLVNLDKESLASEVLSSQRRFEFPSLWQEVLGFLRELEISLEELEESSKYEFRKKVKARITKKNEQDLLLWMEPYKKLNSRELSKEEFKTKDYFHELNLGKARTKFAIDTSMLKTVKSNFASDRKYEDDMWQCEQCSRVDSIRHLIRCPFFAELRVDKDLKNNNEDIVEYFQEIVRYRLEQAQHL